MAIYEYKWIPGIEVSQELCDELVALYSRNYGVWGAYADRPGARIKMSSGRLRAWLSPPDSRVALATYMGKAIGYAIAVQRTIPEHGVISWVTQFVVDEAYRKQNVGKTLLFTIWQFSNHFAWGLVTANPFAIRALEKATRRRCAPARMRQDQHTLLELGTEVAPTYIVPGIETKVTATESRINTNFFIDHSGLQEMLLNVAGPDRRWELGRLEEGWEWFAFTFHDQPQIGLLREELEQMLLASDEVTKQAYSRMIPQAERHKWKKHSGVETEFIEEVCRVVPGNHVLDIGCGDGRHAIALAEDGAIVTAIDYTEAAIEAARKSARETPNVTFAVADAREVDFQEQFDAAICLYDVIGSYVDDKENQRILETIASHLKPGSHVLISVMNFEITRARAKNWFSITSDPDKLLALLPSKIMERTGDIFDPDYYLVDSVTEIVYRKEQFTAGDQLPTELLIRDKRYTKNQIESLCEAAGLEVLWARFVRSGGWRSPLAASDPRAKEILVLCRKPNLPSPLLFE